MENEINFYQNEARLVLGFHGCEKKVRDKVLLNPNDNLTPSNNTYDWLGNGIYFWLNDPQRALEWAEEQYERDKYQSEPSVIGAIIDLGDCLNLAERNSAILLKEGYEHLKNNMKEQNLELQTNKLTKNGKFSFIRELDCAVFKEVHEILEQQSGKSFDTVMGYFEEGDLIYPGAFFHEKSHIQICVRNTDCIKGYFLPKSFTT